MEGDECFGFFGAIRGFSSLECFGCGVSALCMLSCFRVGWLESWLSLRSRDVSAENLGFSSIGLDVFAVVASSFSEDVMWEKAEVDGGRGQRLEDVGIGVWPEDPDGV